MKHKLLLLCALTAGAMGTAFAQPNPAGDNSLGGEPGQKTNAPTKPTSTDAAAPDQKSRADVKKEARDATKNGQIPHGENNTHKKMKRSHGASDAMSGAAESRADVKAEARSATKAGEIPRGEGPTTNSAADAMKSGK